MISYVGDRTGIMPRNWWLTLVIRVPDGVVRVVTRYWVIRLDAMAAAGLLSALHRAYADQDRGLSPEIMLSGASAVGVARWADDVAACALDAARG